MSEVEESRPAQKAPHASGDDEATLRLRADYATNVDNRLQAAALGALALAAMLSPVLLQWLVAALGLRSLAVAIVLAASLSSLAAGSLIDKAPRLTTAWLAAVAWYTESLVPLLLLPAVLYATLAYIFARSRREQASVVERGAKLIQPAAPDFIGPYCRKVTAVWSAVFAINAVALWLSAIAAPIEIWKDVAGYGIWSWMGAITVAEFLVRKTYFRNYWYRGPFERFWSRLFPAEATEMGRRSAQHIRITRKKLGLED